MTLPTGPLETGPWSPHIAARVAAGAIDRLAKKFDMPDGPNGCWLYTGHLARDGYGQFTVNYRSRLAHRVAYELLVGPVPDGLQLDHLCRVRHCVNPDHLEPVTARENTMRGVSPSARNAAKTSCSKGHPFSADNTYVDPNGHRACRECQRAKDLRLRRARQPELLRGASFNLIAANRRPSSANTSGYKGVSFHARRGRWQAYIKVGQRQRYLGIYDTAEAAARAYDAAAIEAWGEFARPNFPLGRAS